VADRSVVYRLRAELGQFRAQMAQASSSTKKLADDLTKTGKEGEKTRRGLDTLGGAAGKFGLVAAAGLGAAIVKAADFDSSMSKVQAATHETAANMEALRQAALQAGADTAFSADEAAAGIEALAKAGVATQQILDGGLMGALDLAAAGEMEVADAAEAAAGAMAQFKLDGEDVPHIADLLAAGAGKAQGEVSDMVMALKQAGTVSSQTGLSLEETTGALAAMAEQSLLGSDAGTSFKTFLASLTPNSAKAAEAMDEFGFSAFDAQGKFVGLEEVAGRMQDAFSGMTAEQRMATMETIFGSDAVRAASIIYDNGAQGIQNWIDKVDDQGFAAETAAIKLDNLKGDLEALRGSLETALIGTGEGAQGPLRSLVQSLTDVVNAYNKLPQGAQSAVAGVLAAGAAIGGSIWVGSKLINGIASTRQALDDLGFSAEKQSKALRGVAKAGVALAAIGATISIVDQLNKKLRETPVGLENLTGQLLDLSQGNITSLSGEFDSLGKSIGRITDPLIGEKIVDNTLGLLADPRRLGNAKAEIEQLDAALANLTTQAGPSVAAQALDDLAQAQGLSADEFDRLKTILPQYDEAVAAAANNTALAAAETDGLGSAAGGAGSQVRKLTRMTKEQAEALKNSREAARETAESFFGLGEKVDKAKVSLNEWLRDLEKQAEALRNFRVNAQTAAKKGLDEGLIAALEEAGPAGALRMRQLANATEAEIARANKAWRSGQREIEKTVDTLGGVPKNVSTTLDVDYKQALTGIDKAIDRLKDFQDKTITLRVTHAGTAAVTPGFGAQGGFAEGGWTGPGGKYQPAGIVHGNEFVFSSEATRGNVAMLERLHRQLRGYASGGLVQRQAAPVFSGGGTLDIDYGRLASALSAMRPPGQLYGDVHIQGDPAAFKQAMLRDRQAAGLGGV
jgi:TP901 family phage tail tape measure protein